MTRYTRFNDIPKFVRDGSYEVDIPLDFLLERLDDMVTHEGLQLDPDFQRGHVWSDKQRTAFIEFFLRGGKTARVIYFNKPSWHNKAKTEYDEFVIVDGKQRLEAWRLFLSNGLRVFGSFFRDYTDRLRIMHTMKFNINDLQTKAEVLQWYIDFNAGGVVHSNEEIDRVRKLLAKESKL